MAPALKRAQGKQKMRTLENKIEVVEQYRKLQPERRDVFKKLKEQFEGLKSLGQVQRWAQTYDKWFWGELPSEIRRMKSLPEWYKELVIGEKAPGWHGGFSAVIRKKMDEMLVQRACGDGLVDPAEDLDHKSVAELCKDVAVKICKAQENKFKDAVKENLQIAQDLEAGKCSIGEALQKKVSLPKVPLVNKLGNVNVSRFMSMSVVPGTCLARWPRYVQIRSLAHAIRYVSLKRWSQMYLTAASV